MRTAKHVSNILGRLRTHHSEPARRSSGDPIGGFVETILSQSTTDRNAERAYANLRRSFPSWDDLLAASVEDVADSIRSGGLADQKAPTIQRALRAIKCQAGGFDPQFLDEFSDPEALEWLQSIKGVGKKTAACVLLFDLERDVLPVDTHVHRISRRLGLVPLNASAAQTQDLLERDIAPVDRFAAHVLMIQHGRATCHAISPKCPRCVLADLCPFAGTQDEIG